MYITAYKAQILDKEEKFCSLDKEETIVIKNASSKDSESACTAWTSWNQRKLKSQNSSIEEYVKTGQKQRTRLLQWKTDSIPLLWRFLPRRDSKRAALFSIFSPLQLSLPLFPLFGSLLSLRLKSSFFINPSNGIKQRRVSFS